MRTIKFKAWDTKNKNWLTQVPYLEYLLDDPDAAVSHHDIDEESSLYWYPNNCLGPDFNGRIQYLQSVGLIDSKGIAIYESDIVKNIYPDEHSVGVVYFDLNVASFRIQCGQQSIPIRTYRFENGEPVGFIDVIDHVIGNIFETPALLK